MGLDLQKKDAIIGLRLKKYDVQPDIKCRVVNIFDGSGSMADLYRNGTMSELGDRIFAVANRFDDNQSLEQYVFSTGFEKLEDATAASFGSYVKNSVIPNCQWGGTKYSPVLRAAIESYDTELVEVKTTRTATTTQEGKKPGFFGRLFGKTAEVEIVEAEVPHVSYEKKTVTPEFPMFIIFQTDGDNETNDERSFFTALESCRGKAIFVAFVGVGDSTFSLLKIAGARYANCDFFSAADIGALSDEQLYDRLLSEKFLSWLKATKI